MALDTLWNQAIFQVAVSLSMPIIKHSHFSKAKITTFTSPAVEDVEVITNGLSLIYNKRNGQDKQFQMFDCS